MIKQPTSANFFQKTGWILGILAGIGLFGYALINVIRMPAVSPDAFVPKSISPAQPDGFPFGMLQFTFILLYSFSFLPVCILFTIKRYAENPYALVLGCSLLCLSLILEIINNLPFAANFIYTEPLAQIPSEVQLYLNQTASIRYLSYDVAGFSVFYAAMLVYMVHYWRSKRILSWLIIVSIVAFGASVPFLWLNGSAAVVLMAISIICVSPIPVYFGKMAAV